MAWWMTEEREWKKWTKVFHQKVIDFLGGCGSGSGCGGACVPHFSPSLQDAGCGLQLRSSICKKRHFDRNLVPDEVSGIRSSRLTHTPALGGANVSGFFIPNIATYLLHIPWISLIAVTSCHCRHTFHTSWLCCLIHVSSKRAVFTCWPIALDPRDPRAPRANRCGHELHYI